MAKRGVRAKRGFLDGHGLLKTGKDGLRFADFYNDKCLLVFIKDEEHESCDYIHEVVDADYHQFVVRIVYNRSFCFFWVNHQYSKSKDNAFKYTIRLLESGGDPDKVMTEHTGNCYSLDVTFESVKDGKVPCFITSTNVFDKKFDDQREFWYQLAITKR